MLGNLIGPEIRELIAERNFSALRAAFVDWSPADVAECGEGTLFNLAATAGPLLLLIFIAIGVFTRRMSRANRGLAGLNKRLTSTNGRLEAASRVSADLAHESAIVNQFTELTALTEDDVVVLFEQD